MKVDDVASAVTKAERTGGINGLRLAMTDEDAEDKDPWSQPPSGKRDAPINGPLPSEVHVVRGNLIYIEKALLPSAMLNCLLRLAAFQNPEFYRAQAMRLSIFGKPRVIRCGEEFSQFIGLPRGSIDEVIGLLRNHNIRPIIQDERFPGNPLEVKFHGTLHPEQEDAVEALAGYDDGVLSATTAFGKTVVAAQMIAKRAVNTLVLVHRRQLLDQWKERLSMFLDRGATSIGFIGGGKNSICLGSNCRPSGPRASHRTEN